MKFQNTILNALERYRGDDLYRARSAFRGLSDEEMDKQYGQSGKTKRQIVDEYAEHDSTVEAAINWVKAQASDCAEHESDSSKRNSQ